MSDLRTIEAQSIRAFVQSAADDGYLSGRVLDYGCGKQPYRHIVEAAGGEYVGYDRPWFPGYVTGAPTLGPIPEEVFGMTWDTILCTQVLQYVAFPKGDIHHFSECAKALVLTYPTNWPEVEPEDLHRFTKAGMERLLTEAGFEIVRHERRASLDDVLDGAQNFPDQFALGYGVIARA